MSDNSAIEWTDTTWNPVTGCDRVSPGCAHCYALDLAARLKRMGQVRYQRDGGRTSGPGFGVTLHPDKLEEPLRWRRPRRIFVNSMSDMFHEQVPFEYVDRVFTVMAEADQHTFQVLTKRPERMLAYFEHAADYMGLALADLQPWPNIWLGVSIENRRFTGRADVLRATPAAVRFISAEPLLGPLMPDHVYLVDHPLGRYEAGQECWRDRYQGAPLDLAGIDWLIVGGESGPGHRPIDPGWVRDLRDATRCPTCRGIGWLCAATEQPADGNFCGLHGFECPSSNGCPTCHLPGECGGRGYHTAFFFKQWGGSRPKSNGRELDGRSWDEMPLSVAA